MSSNYTRVVPRDLFRESLLLKCLGRLVLLIHDGKLPWLKFYHNSEFNTELEFKGFEISCRDEDGGLECNTVKFYPADTPEDSEMWEYELDIYTGLARQGDHWPLLCTVEAGEEIEVFDNEGNINPEFEKAVTCHHYD